MVAVVEQKATVFSLGVRWWRDDGWACIGLHMLAEIGW